MKAPAAAVVGAAAAFAAAGPAVAAVVVVAVAVAAVLYRIAPPLQLPLCMFSVDPVVVFLFVLLFAAGVHSTAAASAAPPSKTGEACRCYLFVQEALARGMES